MAREIILVILAIGSSCIPEVDGAPSHPPHMLPGRHVMVHLFEWRWEDIAVECETVLGPLGYGGLQTSPANENAIVREPLDRPWWERYQPISYKLDTRSGNAQAFADMVARCNNAGVRVYVDAVLNHMTNWGVSPLTGTGGSVGFPNQRYFPAVPFLPEHFSNCSLLDISDPTPEEFKNCDLGYLVDLKQEYDYVKDQIGTFLDTLVSFGVAGFRIDAARHMWSDDLESIFGRVRDLNTTFGFPTSARPFIFHEVIDLGDSPIPPSDYFHLGVVTEFRYSNELGFIFSGRKPLAELQNFLPGTSLEFMPEESAFVFVDNHDNQRAHCGECTPDVISHKRPRLYVMATAFHLAWDYGVRRIMSSYAFNDTEVGPPMDVNENTLPVTTNPDGSCGNGWVCEHRWPQIAAMVAFRAQVEGTQVTNFWTNGADQIAFCRGDQGFIAFNNEQVPMNESIQTCLRPGTYCDVITGQVAEGGLECTGVSVTVDQDGLANIVIAGALEGQEGVVALHAGATLQVSN